MQVNAIAASNKNSVNFNARLTLRYSFDLGDKQILTNDFVKYYSDKVSALGSQKVTVKIAALPHYQDYTMDVEIVRNQEKYKKAQSLLLCPNIKEALPKFLEDEYKWLVCWFKDKNGTEKLK